MAVKGNQACVHCVSDLRWLGLLWQYRVLDAVVEIFENGSFNTDSDSISAWDNHYPG